ncbi:MAG: hypothetical protein ACYCOO_06855 [Chitinophagaceae bacterium]
MQKLMMGWLLSLIVTSGSFVFSYGQDTLRYSTLEHIHHLKGIPRYKGRNVYISKEGLVFHKGDTLQFGKPYLENNYSYINSGGPDISPNAVSLGTGSTPGGVSIQLEGERILIRKIYIAGNPAVGYRAEFLSRIGYGILYAPIYIDVEKAIQSGEIVSSFISSDQALKKLAVYKEKLNLGLISVVEYNQKERELKKYIH